MIKVNSEYNTVELPPKNANSPNAMYEPGIYYYSPKDPEKQLKKVGPLVVASTETHGSSYYIIGGGGRKSSISGSESK